MIDNHACKQSELVSAINSFGAARATNDANLIQFSGQLIGQLLEGIEFAPEEPAEETTVTINLNNAAKYYKEMPHQVAAWNFLESKIPESILDEFADIYRAGPANPSAKIITPMVMQKLTGFAADKFDATFCDDFNKMLMTTKFETSKSATAMLTANLMHETGNFVWMKESQMVPLTTTVLT